MALLGLNGYKPFTVGDTERRSSLYILGKPGTGKSTLLINLLHEDMGKGYSGFFLDPHGESVSRAIESLPENAQNSDVTILNPTDDEYVFGINPLYCPNLASFSDRKETEAKAYNVFKRLWEKNDEWGVWLNLIMQNIIPVFIETGYTLAEANLFLTDRDFRRHVLGRVQYSQSAIDFWHREFKQDQAQPAIVRIRTLLGNEWVAHILGQKQTTIDFDKIVNTPGKFAFLKLPPRLSDEARHLIGTIIVSELQHVIMNRKDKSHPFCMYVDEFQHFATDQFAQLILEARKQNCILSLAHQERRGQFGENEKILGATMACANKVVFQCTVRDARELAVEFAEKPTFTETRKIPELVISKEPVWDLLHKGHPNPRIQELVYIHFTPFYERIWRLRAELEQKYLIRMEFLDEASEFSDTSLYRKRAYKRG